MALNLTEFLTQEAASEAAAGHIADALSADVSGMRRASLMVSGGASPVRTFELLSTAALAWSRVTIGLVDERWVAPDHPDSNERLVRTHLLKGEAQVSNFIAMKTADARPEDGAADRNSAYAPHCDPANFVLLGMGSDGHTASWFPCAPGLRDVLSPAPDQFVAAVEAPMATVPLRMTLTGAAVLSARSALLLVFGDEKRSVLLSAGNADPLNCPVRFVIDGLGDRLKIFWAP